MTFTSVQFAIFFAVLLVLLATIRPLRAQKLILLAASYGFYAYFVIGDFLPFSLLLRA